MYPRPESPDAELSRAQRLERRTASSGWNRYDTALIAVGAIATIVVHPVHAMLSHPYWLDESWVAVLTRAPFLRLPSLSASAPAGFVALLKLVPGTGLQRARLVPLGFAALSTVMAYVITRSLSWPTRASARFAAVVAGLIVMLAPLSLRRNDLKQYTCDAFCALVVLTIGAWAERDPRRSRLLWLAGAAVIAIPFSSTSAFVSVAMFAGLLASALLARNMRRAVEIVAAGAIAAVGLGAYLGLVVLPTLNPKLKAFWATQYLSGSPLDVVRASWDRLAASTIALAMPVAVFIGLFLVGIAVLVKLRCRALAVALPLLWIEMAAMGRLRRYPYLDLRTSNFLLVASLVVVAIGAVGLVLAIARAPRVAGRRFGVAIAVVAGGVMAVSFFSAFVHHLDQQTIPNEDVREETLVVAKRLEANDVVLVNDSARFGFAYYWPRGPLQFHSTDASGQGFRPEVKGVHAIYAEGRTDAEVLAAMRAATTRWRAAPAGSRLYIVRTHISPGEITAWHRAFEKFHLEPHRENVGGDLLLVIS